MESPFLDRCYVHRLFFTPNYGSGTTYLVGGMHTQRHWCWWLNFVEFEPWTYLTYDDAWMESYSSCLSLVTFVVSISKEANCSLDRILLSEMSVSQWVSRYVDVQPANQVLGILRTMELLKHIIYKGYFSEQTNENKQIRQHISLQAKPGMKKNWKWYQVKPAAGFLSNFSFRSQFFFSG